MATHPWLTASCLGLCAISLWPGSSAAQPGLSFVVVMVDDLDEDAFDTLLAEELVPNLQSIADSGIRFSRSFVSSPLCSPSRATFLTGQYAHNHRLVANVPLADNAAGLGGGAAAFDDTSTVATWLQAGGYTTAYVGKYLSGYGGAAVLESPKDDPTYVPPGWAEWYGLVDPTTYSVFDFDINENGVVQHYPRGPGGENYQTDILADLSVDFIQRATAPFFLVVNPLAPHVESGSVQPECPPDRRHRWGHVIRPDPSDAVDKPEGWARLMSFPLLPALDPSFRADSQDAPWWIPGLEPMTDVEQGCLTVQYRTRLASMLAVDDLVGRVVAELDSRGVLDETYIVFTSDNGLLQGQHNWGSKLLAYEESVRVPLLIRAPGGAGPRVVDAMVLNNDLAPTLAALAGVAEPPTHTVDGRSLLPFINGDAGAVARDAILLESWFVTRYAAIRTAQGVVFDGVPVGELTFIAYLELATSRVLDRELFDLALDPFQLDNRPTGVVTGMQVTKLQQRLETLHVCAGASCRTGEGP